MENIQSSEDSRRRQGPTLAHTLGITAWQRTRLVFIDYELQVEGRRFAEARASFKAGPLLLRLLQIMMNLVEFPSRDLALAVCQLVEFRVTLGVL